MAVLYTPHFMQFFDDNGDPLSLGKLYTYTAGTNTPKATYTDAGGLTPNANPIILDSAGRAVIFIDGSYKFRLETAASVLVREVDNVSAFTTSAVTIDSLLPNQSGNAGKFLTTNGAASSWGAVTASGPTLGAPITTTSGTAVDFTGIPSTVKQIIISLESISSASGGFHIIQIGDSGGVETSGYNTNGNSITTGTTGVNSNINSGIIYFTVNNLNYTGNIILSLLDSSTNTWEASCVIKGSTTTLFFSSGTKSLSATLDRVRLTTVGGTDTYNGGKINIQYQ